MFKISWGQRSDEFATTFVIVPDVHTLYTVWFLLNGYGRNDGSTPVNIKATNLDGEEIDMTKGLQRSAGNGTYSRLRRN